MIHWAWLIPAFIFGAGGGFITLALMMATKND